MFKKIKGFPSYLWEKVFKRKELNRLAVAEHLLGKEVEAKVKEIQGKIETFNLLTTGQSMNLTQAERQMIRKAIEAPGFNDWITNPATKAHKRITWKDLKRKIKLSLKEDREVKEDDETKAGDNG